MQSCTSSLSLARVYILLSLTCRSWDELKPVIQARIKQVGKSFPKARSFCPLGPHTESHTPKQNVADYLSTPLPPFQGKGPQASTRDGHVEPPFRPRALNPKGGPTRTLSAQMDQAEATEMCQSVLVLLDEFPSYVLLHCPAPMNPQN